MLGWFQDSSLGEFAPDFVLDENRLPKELGRPEYALVTLVCLLAVSASLRDWRCVAGQAQQLAVLDPFGDVR